MAGKESERVQTDLTERVLGERVERIEEREIRES